MSRDKEARLDDMLDAFAQRHPEAAASYRKLIDSTAQLTAGLLEAIGKGNLERFEALPEEKQQAGAFGSYVSVDIRNAAGDVVARENTIQLNIEKLEFAAQDAKEANLMRMVLSHEAQHAVNKQAIRAQTKALDAAIQKIADGSGPHDYTDAVRDWREAARTREASDQIAGVNAVADHLRKQHPNESEQRLLERIHDDVPEGKSFVEMVDDGHQQTYALRNGLKLEKGQIAQTPEQVEAMAKAFFDDPGRNYRVGYARGGVEYALGKEVEQQEKDRAANPDGYVAPEVRVNLEALGLVNGRDIVLLPGVVDTSPSLRTPRQTDDRPAPEQGAGPAERDTLQQDQRRPGPPGPQPSMRPAPGHASSEDLLDRALAAYLGDDDRAFSKVMDEYRQSPPGQAWAQEQQQFSAAMREQERREALQQQAQQAEQQKMVQQGPVMRM